MLEGVSLKSMKISKEERESRYSEKSAMVDAPVYPWGLSLTLDDEALEKLGLDKLPAAGSAKCIVAEVEVTASSVNDTTDGKRKSLSLQITKLALVDMPKEKSSPEEKLYATKG